MLCPGGHSLWLRGTGHGCGTLNVHVERKHTGIMTRMRVTMGGWVVMAALILSLHAEPLRAQKIVIITSDTLTSTLRSVSGGKAAIKHENAPAEFYEFLLKQDAKFNPRTADSIKAIKPNLVLTVGSFATEFARANLADAPTVFCSVMYPVISGFVESFGHPGKNMTGSSLTIPVDIQFRYFRQIIPSLKNLGVLYTDNTAPLIPPSAVVAKQMGLNLIAIKVVSDKDLSVAMDSLTKVTEGIWSVADPNLFNAQSTKFILINAIRKGIPFMGFSRNVVESGALFALDFDYKAIGRQAGGLANQILKGSKPSETSVTTPDVIWFHYNEKTAKHMNITIPPELVAVAKEVYR